MRRVLVVLLAVLCSAVLPATAHAAAVSAPAKQTPAEVHAYWTAERMRDAKPKEQERGGGPAGRAKPSGSGGTAGFTSGEVTDFTAPYAKTNGKVFFTQNGVDYVCSGTAIDSATDDIVWTAGHCVHGGAGGTFHTNWKFMPAYRDGTSLGTYVAAGFHTTTEWATATQYGRDVGAVRVTSPFDAVIGPLRQIDTSTSFGVGAAVTAYGYSAARKFNGQRLRFCSSTVSRMDAWSDPPAMGLPCDLTGGSSGGAWVTSGLQISVNSYGYSSLKNTMFGPTLSDTRAVLTAAETGGASYSTRTP